VTKTKLKATTAAFEKPPVVVKPKKNEPATDVTDDEPELEEAVEDRRGPADIDQPALGARAPPDTPWMRQTDVAKHLLVSPMTIHRYLNHPKYAHLNFPKPTAVIVDRSYWDRADIDAWMRSRNGAISSRKFKSKAVA
jgi:predicted DNA-binding transcriptional regulator AlpA